MRHVRTCLVVASHPRSGTHLTIDFVRRNFPAFNPWLWAWEPRDRSYLDLDARQPGFNRSSCVVAKTHSLDPAQALPQIAELTRATSIIVLYPYRDFSSTMKSYAEFIGAKQPVFAFTNGPDPFFKTADSVAECVVTHAEAWTRLGAYPLDIARLIANPEQASLALERLAGMSRACLARRLPARMPLRRLARLMDRALGRESTEILVKTKMPWLNIVEKHLIERQFAPLKARLDSRRIN